MPSMTWFGRRWRMASDELVFPLGFDFALGVAVIILLFGTLNFTGKTNSNEEKSLLPSCPRATPALQWCLFGVAVSNILVTLTVLATSALSLRGSVFEESKRRKVGIGLYTVLVAVLGTLGFTLTGFYYVWWKRQLQGCTREIITIQAALLLSLSLCGLFLLFVLSAFDPIGGRRYEVLDDYSHVWWKRLRWICCGCTAENETNNAYESAAVILAQSFRAYDVVTSDIVAGVLLLNGYQTTSLRENAGQVLFRPSPDGVREKRTVQTVSSPPLSVEHKEAIHRFREYSRFYMATYGWMLQQYMHCCTGICNVVCSDPCMCCRSRPGKHFGSRTNCDLSTVLLVTGLKEEHVLVSQWKSDIFKPVHYVAYDEATNAIVVAIRGTQSLPDCITDISAFPTLLELNEIPSTRSTEDYYVHGGMYESAAYVQRSLEYYGVLDSILSGKYKDSAVVVLGHSLGAGVSIILSTLLWSKYAELRNRLQCLAYSPPGGVMSEATVEYCASFTIGCFAGQDMIPRVAQHTFDRFREDMFDLIAASPHPKAYLFFKCFNTSDLVRSFHPSSPRAHSCNVSIESASHRESLRRTTCRPDEEPKKLFPCKTLIHFRKMVERIGPGLCPANEEVFVPTIEGPEDVQVIIAAPTMFLDHFPDFLYKVLQNVCDRLDDGDLDRYYQLPTGSPTAPNIEIKKDPSALEVHIPALQKAATTASVV